MMRTKKPCPGCGEIRDRDADQVCDPCRSLIRRGKAAVEAEQQRQAESLPCWVPTRWNCIWPRRTPARPAPEYAVLARTFGDLITAAFPSCQWGPAGREIRALDYDRQHLTWQSLTDRQMEAVQRHLEALPAALEAARQQGLAEGQSMLLQLAQGTISEQAFNEASVRKPRD